MKETTPVTKLKYIDVFAGCGGQSVGFFNSGHWQGLFAVEVDSDAFSTLKYNLLDNRAHFATWPQWLPRTSHDINAVVSTCGTALQALNGCVDLVAGGPPCQGFSVAGRRREHDERNGLVHSYLRFIKLVRPRAILFENVKGFGIGFLQADKSRGKPYSEIVLDGLRGLGYADATFKVVDFSTLGIPQRRERFIIVATLAGKAESFFSKLDAQRDHFLQERGLCSPVTVRQAISDLERRHGTVQSPDSRGFLAGTYRRGNLSRYQQHLRPKPLDEAAIPDSHRFARHSDPTVRKYRDIVTRRLSPSAIRQAHPTRKSCTILLKGDAVGPTLTILPDDFIHYSEPRILSPREYARLQSFPDWFELKGAYTTGGKERRHCVPRYSQIGNAIPPLFAEQAANVLSDILTQS
ncbi:MAG: DNA cytosine methyltransferase [Kiritimatiellia bacterium]|jgi:DNA (cytosine-5)-methyltransferase 1